MPAKSVSVEIETSTSRPVLWSRRDAGGSEPSRQYQEQA